MDFTCSLSTESLKFLTVNFCIMYLTGHHAAGHGEEVPSEAKLPCCHNITINDVPAISIYKSPSLYRG